MDATEDILIIHSTIGNQREPPQKAAMDTLQETEAAELAALRQDQE